jgi:hypothetical protein
LPYVAELLKRIVDVKISFVTDEKYFDTQVRKKIKIKSFLEDKDVKVKALQRNLKSSK